MTKKPIRPRDPNQLAKLVIDLATGETDEPEAAAPSEEVVEQARRAGRSGGKGRSDALSADRRKEIAQAAAAARWKKSG